MSIEKITARILQEAKDEAAAVVAKAQEERDALVAAAEEQAETIKVEAAKKAQTDARVLVERRQSVAELEARKLRLAAKQEMVEQVFVKALEELATMETEKYKEFLLTMLKPYADEPGEIIFNERDREQLSSSLQKELAGGKLVIAQDVAKIRGGFILRRGSISLNASLEKLLENEKKQMTAQIAQLLFS